MRNATLRYVEPAWGTVYSALPSFVVAEDDERIVLAFPGGTCAWPTIDGRPHRDVPLERRFRLPWRGGLREWEPPGTVIVHRRGRAHSVYLFPDGWYVNLERPWTASRHGWDTRDHVLDVWCEPRDNCRWKDEDELAAAVRAGLFTQDDADEFRAEGERVVAEWPFPTGWEVV